ncbi:hypothetical protein Zmor_009080 [Zophobas morio]|uniref:Uncharacterized protein n=1 Tax=Zophobas morio TaxID=2755281 RepID=A0AA38LZU6_9CUCU|nr:hypothetical protein Zmor_009080 [Zophobas morio]
MRGSSRTLKLQYRQRGVSSQGSKISNMYSGRKVLRAESLVEHQLSVDGMETAQETLVPYTVKAFSTSRKTTPKDFIKLKCELPTQQAAKVVASSSDLFKMQIGILEAPGVFLQTLPACVVGSLHGFAHH